MKYKKYYLVFSLVLLVPGIASLFLYGMQLGIEFTGGSVFEYELERGDYSEGEIKNGFADVFTQQGIQMENISLYLSESTTVVVRTQAVESSTADEIQKALEEKYKELNIVQMSYESLGPSMGKETTKNAFIALSWASFGILLYIAFAFRNIPKPYSGFRFGVSALVAMLHDALMLIGVFSLLGKFLGIEVDSLFITAVLTVIGFSIHDSIVVFDRIRENLKKLPTSYSFTQVVNYSVVETLNRSFATSLTVLITLLLLFLLGGESIKYFVLALLIGIISGTYSSIFTASPLLVIWEDHIAKKRMRKQNS